MKRELKIAVALLSIVSLVFLYHSCSYLMPAMDSYERLLYTEAKYNPKIPTIHGTGYFPFGFKEFNDTLKLRIDHDFKKAKEIGFNVVRFASLYKLVSEYNPPLSLYPLDTRVTEYMDYIIQTANRYNLKVIPTLLDDSFEPLLDYPLEDLKAWIQAIVIRYKDDPAIYAWDIVNEPRIEHEDIVVHLIIHLKSVDGLHPVTSGEAHPVNQTKIRNAVDIISLHWYPSDYLFNGEVPYPYLIDKINVAKTFNKPVLLEEFSLDTRKFSERAQEFFFFTTLDVVKNSSILGYTILDLRDRKHPTLPDVSVGIGILRSDGTPKPAVAAFP